MFFRILVYWIISIFIVIIIEPGVESTAGDGLPLLLWILSWAVLIKCLLMSSLYLVGDLPLLLFSVLYLQFITLMVHLQTCNSPSCPWIFSNVQNTWKSPNWMNKSVKYCWKYEFRELSWKIKGTVLNIIFVVSEFKLIKIIDGLEQMFGKSDLAPVYARKFPFSLCASSFMLSPAVFGKCRVKLRGMVHVMIYSFRRYLLNSWASQGLRGI